MEFGKGDVGSPKPICRIRGRRYEVIQRYEPVRVRDRVQPRAVFRIAEHFELARPAAALFAVPGHCQGTKTRGQLVKVFIGPE